MDWYIFDPLAGVTAAKLFVISAKVLFSWLYLVFLRVPGVIPWLCCICVIYL